MTAVEHLDADHSTYGMSRADWLAERRKGIGGSDAPALVGLDPWNSPFSIWAEKTGQGLDRDEPSEQMEWGNLLEPVIAHVWERRTGRRLIRPSGIIAHKDYPWMLASIDRFVLGDDGEEVAIWEGKTTNAYADRDWDFESGVIPDRVVVQGVHYLAVTGLPVCHVAVLVGGQQLRTCEIERDERLIADLIRVEERFWTENVLANRPPPMDGHQATTEAVKEMWPDSNPDTELHLPGEAARLVADYRAADARIKDAESDKDAAANQLKALLGDSETGLIDGLRAVTWKTQESATLDRKALRDAHPDICEQFTHQSTTRVFRLVRSYQP